MLFILEVAETALRRLRRGLSLWRAAGSRRVVLSSDPHSEAKWWRCLYCEGGEGRGAVTCSEVVVMVKKLRVCVWGGAGGEVFWL